MNNLFNFDSYGKLYGDTSGSPAGAAPTFVPLWSVDTDKQGFDLDTNTPAQTGI